MPYGTMLANCPNCRREFFVNVKGEYCPECWRGWGTQDGSYEARTVLLPSQRFRPNLSSAEER